MESVYIKMIRTVLSGHGSEALTSETRSAWELAGKIREYPPHLYGTGKETVLDTLGGTESGVQFGNSPGKESYRSVLK